MNYISIISWMISSFALTVGCFYLLIFFRRNHEKENLFMFLFSSASAANAFFAPFHSGPKATICQIIMILSLLFIMMKAYKSLQRFLNLFEEIGYLNRQLEKEVERTSIELENAKKEIIELDKIRGQFSELSEMGNEYITLLKEKIESEKLYLDPEITIEKIAVDLGISSRALSKIINSLLGNNFNMLINSYRVEEAKKFLRDEKYKHYNMLAIGMDVGFNSKSNFNVVFKKFTGQTPTEFQQQNFPLA